MFLFLILFNILTCTNVLTSCAIIHHVIMHWHAPKCKGFHIHTPKASLGQLQRQTEIWYAPSMLLCKYQSHIWHIWDKNGCANEGYIRILSQNTRINLHKNGLKISFMVAWKDVLVNNWANWWRSVLGQWKWVSIGGIIRRQ